MYRRRLRPGEVASAELAAYLCEISREIERQVGILVGRRGEIEHVFVGDASRINLPEIGRIRAGRGRFRGLRLVHTHLRNEPLTRDDLVDLALLRLDLVAAIGVWPDGRPADLHVAHLLPPVEGGPPWSLLPTEPFFRSTLDPAALIAALEEEFERVAPAVIATDKRDRALLVVVDIRRPPRVGGAPRPLPTSSESRVNELKELCRTAGVRVVGVLEQRRPEADPKYADRARQARRGADPRDAARRRRADLRSRPDAGPGARDRRLHRAQGHRSHDADPRHLRAAREEPRRQAAGRAGAAPLPAAAPAREEHDDEPADRRHRRARPRRDEARENRRRARERIHRLEKEIDRFGEQRAGRRAERVRRGLPIVAIVGYTNAGKSTLLNTLTRSDVLAEDKLFATLDPTTRRLRFPREREIIITDTVGFIRDLPRDLARAFRATLEELDEADLLLHVVDAADPAREQQIAAVEAILADLGLAETRRILVMNKIDLLAPDGSRAGAPARVGTAICPVVADLREGRRDDGGAAGGGRGGAGQPGVRGRRARPPATRRARAELAVMSPIGVAAAARRAAGRAHPGARAGALRVREAVST